MSARLVVVVALLAATGLLHGRWTDRWGVSGDIDAAAANLPAIPMVMGEWEGRELTREESAVAARSTSPQVVRRYVNRTSGAAVGLLVTCGRPSGMIIEHNPKECYKLLGYEEIGDGRKVSVGPPDQLGEFYAHTFVKTAPTATTRVRLMWAWGDGTSWSFPERPRIVFARTPVLYKFYVTRDMISEDEPLNEDVLLSFLDTAIPEVTAALARPPK